MPAPPLLEAINQNSLAIFLLVRFPSHFGYAHANICGVFASAGERIDWRGEPLDADDVCIRYPCYVCVGRVRVRRERARVGYARPAGVEIVMRTCGEDGIQDGGRTQPCELQAAIPGL